MIEFIIVLTTNWVTLYGATLVFKKPAFGLTAILFLTSAQCYKTIFDSRKFRQKFKRFQEVHNSYVFYTLMYSSQVETSYSDFLSSGSSIAT